MDWFRDEVLRGTVLLPTAEFFPGAYERSGDDVPRVLDLLCGLRHLAHSTTS